MTCQVSPLQAFRGSDGDLTKRLFGQLEERGPAGVLALNLFRAQKNSARAKVYRGGIRGKGSYRSMAYDRKNWAMNNLCAVLMRHASEIGIVWGWKIDPAAEYHNWVLYVDLPNGQVSFHAGVRGEGPDYPGEWDRKHASEERVIEYCEKVLTGKTF